MSSLIRHRLENDFPLAIITLIGAIAVVGILPFAVYRFVSGSIIVGSIDAGMLLCIVWSSAYAWRTGRVRIAALVTTTMTMAGSVSVALLVGGGGAMWVYPAILAAFLLLRHWEAAMVSVAAAAVVAFHGGAFETPFQTMTFLATTAVVAMFAFIFAYRAEQLRNQMHVLATRDPLTGAANRRSMEEEVLLATENCRRTGSPCGLAMLDLDHFKRINDCHGHAAGDQVLVAFVRLVRSTTRKGDRIFRYGGEEFVLLLPGADATALRQVLENLRFGVECSLECKGEPVTVSIGATSLGADPSWELALERADVALYQAKQGGRNRVVLSESEDPRTRATHATLTVTARPGD